MVVKEHSIPKKTEEEKKEKHLLRTVKFGGCTGNLVKADSHMDSTQYQQILEHNVQEEVTKLKLYLCWIFQQANHHLIEFHHFHKKCWPFQNEGKKPRQ